MGSLLIYIIGLTIVELYLFISIGSKIGAFTTIILIFFTAIIGVYYAKYEGLNTLKSGIYNLRRNETPIFEVISGAAIAFAAVLLIVPGFRLKLSLSLLTELLNLSLKFLESLNVFLLKNY